MSRSLETICQARAAVSGLRSLVDSSVRVGSSSCPLCDRDWGFSCGRCAVRALNIWMEKEKSPPRCVNHQARLHLEPVKGDRPAY